MIPKRLIFIWLGSEIPDYGRFCMQNFKKVNPNFEIMLVHEPNIENIQNKDLKDCLSFIHSENYNFYKHMVVRPWAKKHLFGEVGHITAISDAFRFYLLNKYGGIYLDLDTFPVKSFDDKLLSYKNGFTVNHVKKRCDYFFLGFNSGCVDCGRLLGYRQEYAKGQVFSNEVHKVKYPEELVSKFKSIKPHIMEKFKQGTLQYGESLMNKIWPEYYIDHFRMESWSR